MKEPLSNRLKEHRQAKEMTQQDLSQVAGVSRQSIISIERSKYVPSLPLALQLAELFGCHVDELFRREENDSNG